MIFNATKNWKRFLSVDNEIVLNEILEATAKHRGAYKNADDVKIAQLWCGMIETGKKIDAIDTRLKRIEFILGGLFRRNEEDKDMLLKSLRKF